MSETKSRIEPPTGGIRVGEWWIHYDEDDPGCWIISEGYRVSLTTGKRALLRPRYFGRLEHAARWLADREARELLASGLVDDIESYAKALREHIDRHGD